jgi:hypothetical protein
LLESSRGEPASRSLDKRLRIQPLCSSLSPRRFIPSHHQRLCRFHQGLLSLESRSRHASFSALLCSALTFSAPHRYVGPHRARLGLLVRPPIARSYVRPASRGVNERSRNSPGKVQCSSACATLGTTAFVAYWVYRIVVAPLLSPLRVVPGPPSEHPLWGNLRPLIDEDPGRAHADWAEKYGGAVRYRGLLGVSRRNVLFRLKRCESLTRGVCAG